MLKRRAESDHPGWSVSEAEQDPVGLLGMGGFLSPSSLQDLPWVPKGRFEQLLIKGGTAKKPPEARLKGPEKLIKKIIWDQIRGVQALNMS